MPELTTAPTDTLDIANDLLWFSDVSETPDAINKSTLASMLSSNAAAARTALSVDPTDSALYVDDFATLQDAYTAFETAPEAQLLGNPSATYTVTATQTLNNLVNKTVDMRGATIAMTGASAFYGTRFTGTWSGSTFKNARFTSDLTGSHVGIQWDTAVNGTTLEGCTFGAMFQGIVYQGSGFANANIIRGNRITGQSNAGLMLAGEYVLVQSNIVYQVPSIGIYGRGGNQIIVGNSIADNNQGIVVDSSGLGNGDHGTIANNMINHNTQVGICLKDLMFGMVVQGNQISANAGSTFGAAPEDHAFGILMKNATGVQCSNNTFINNEFSMGIEGMVKSLITGNHFTGATFATRHAYEIGGTNNNYIFNNNLVRDDLTGGHTVVLATDMPGATLGTNIVI